MSNKYLIGSEKLQAALSAGNVGAWRWRIGSDELWWTDNLESVHGLPEGIFDGKLSSFQGDLHPQDAEDVWAAIKAAVETGDSYRVTYRTAPRHGAQKRWLEACGGVVVEEDGTRFLTGICMDATSRIDLEIELARRLRQQQALQEFSSYALSEEHFDKIMDKAVEIAAEIFDVPLAKILRFADRADRLHLVAGIGWLDGYVGTAEVGVGTDSQAGYTLQAGTPVVVEDFEKDTRFTGPELLHQHNVRSGASVTIAGEDPDRPFGVFGVHDTAKHRFDYNDINLLASLANIIARASRQQSAAERQRLLLREMAHRAGNLLQVVSAIASQTFTTTSDLGAAQKAFNDRLRALMRANHLISAGGWKNARISQLLHETLEAFRDKIEFKGDEILVPADISFDLGLVIHEIATNAAKYGALGRKDGKVSLSWQVREVDGPILSLHWIDAEAKVAPESGTRRGFGSELIDALMVTKWTGTVTRPRGKGFRLKIAVPLTDRSQSTSN